MLGYPDQPWHLEFTSQRGHPAGKAPTEDNLLVFYLPNRAEWEQGCQDMLSAGFCAVPSANPYWEQRGKTFEDLDGYRVVLQNARVDDGCSLKIANKSTETAYLSFPRRRESTPHEHQTPAFAGVTRRRRSGCQQQKECNLMNTRQLTSHGPDITESGLGCWQLGGGWGNPWDDDVAQEILSAAYDAGVRFFDTANVYGDGESELSIGRFLKTHRDVFVATKLGHGAIYPDGYTRQALREATERSLERLGVDCLDLTQLHCVPIEELRKGDVFDWLREQRDEGLIARFGASVESVEEGLICLEQEGLTSLQVIFNIFRQKPLDELFPRAQEKGVGIIVRLPLASGLLTGKLTRETKFREDDHRNFNRDGAAFNVGETFAGLPYERGVELSEEVTR